jgi:hypothetical protein
MRRLYTIYIKLKWCNKFIFIHRHLPYILIDFRRTYLLYTDVFQTKDWTLFFIKKEAKVTWLRIDFGTLLSRWHSYCKADIIFTSFSPWYRCEIAYLALNNNYPSVKNTFKICEISAPFLNKIKKSATHKDFAKN